ncbi:MAG: hypothetical protein LBV00_01745 [Propionibacteriaceae bacterium]|jgi:uncharacterized protein YukE|nr:hypothetical protein [Propionibacteriaceae bacterium]
MASVGGDLQTLSDLFKKFTDAASQTEALRNSVDSAMNSAVWTGPNADNFRTSWSEFKATLTKIQQALTDGSVDVKNQHNNIAAATGAAERI